VTPRRKAAAAAGVLAMLVVVYNVTHGQNVPAWLDLHVQRNVQSAYHWVTQNTGRNWFLILTKSIGDGLGWAVRQVVHALHWMRWTGVVTLTAVIGYLRGGWRTAVVGGVMMFAVGLCGFWDKAMITLAIMLVAVALSMLVGVPLGIWSGLNDGVERRLRPLLDTAQVMPAFVYLIPIVSLFGIGFAPAVLATMVYAVPPAVRLTNLGIRQVPVVATEVGAAYGSTTRQLLGKVQLPMARPAIALGLNQVIMMAFGIVVIASLLGTSDVGQEVLSGLQKQDVQRSFAAGFSIVFAAIALDRISTGHGAALDERLPLWLRAPRRWMAASAGLVLLAAVVGKVLNLGEFLSWRLDVGDWANTVIRWVNSHWRRGLPLIGGTESISDFLTLYVLSPVRDVLQGSAWWLVAVVAALLGWLARGWRLAAISALCFVGIAAMANWDLAMDTLSQVLVAVVLSMLLAIPIGIWAGRSPWAGRVLRPILDTAQVLPQFVYLVPVIFLFNVGRVPGLIASVIYGIPPGIRLVSLGLSEAPVPPREAAVSYGATPRQELLKVQLPLALKSIMLGINQVILMVLATVIIAGLIGAGALGLEAVSGFTKPNLKLGDGAAAGASIVLLAVFLDRLTQAWGRRFDYSHGH
jgi:glycine betaine/proline transport system permease protein